MQVRPKSGNTASISSDENSDALVISHGWMDDIPGESVNPSDGPRDLLGTDLATNPLAKLVARPIFFLIDRRTHSANIGDQDESATAYRR